MQENGKEKNGIAEVRALAGRIGGVTLGILAGGRSTRMGRDKALLVWHGRTLAEHIAEQFADCPVLISAADADMLAGLSYPIVTDERQGYGPLEGVYRLLLAAQTPWMFVVATDLPLVSRELLACLLERIALLQSDKTIKSNLYSNGKMNIEVHAIEVTSCANGQQFGNRGIEAVVPCSGGRVHPLCGLYHKCAIPKLEALFAWGEHRVRALLDELKTVYVPLEECGLDARVLTNVNTPEEFDRLLDLEEHYESCNHYIE